MTPIPHPPRIVLFAALAGAILAMSLSSILVKDVAARGVPLLSIAAWRMALATALLAPIFVKRRQARRIEPRPQRQSGAAGPRSLVASGLLLALHFAAWTQSLAYMTVARSVLLVSTHPVMTAVGERIFLGRPLSVRSAVGTATAVVGIGVLVAADSDLSASWRGDALALLGAVSLSAYFLLSRRLRESLGLIDYVVPLYAVAATALFVVAGLLGAASLPEESRPWLGLLALAIFPTILGHMIMSWAIRHLSASAISTAFLGEAIGAALLAWMLLGEIPSGPTVLGGSIVLAGIVFVLSAASAPARAAN